MSNIDGRQLNAPIPLLFLLLVPVIVCPDAHASDSPVVGELVKPLLLRGVEDVHLAGEYAYLPCREGQRLTVCSVKDPTRPFVVSSFTHKDLQHAAGVALHGDTLYVTSQGNQRLLVIDASDKAALRLVGSVVVGSPGNGVLYKVAYKNGYCYVANQSEQTLFVVDVRRAEHPVVVAGVPVTTDRDGPFSILLHGSHALVGTIFGSQNRLAIVDIGNPLEPQFVTDVVGPAVGQVSGEVVDNIYFAVNWDTNALLVFDIADAAASRLIGTLVDERLGKPNRCVVSGDRAYLPMTSGHGVAVVDISDSSAPVFLTSFKHPAMQKTYGAAVRGDLLYVGSRDGNSLVVLNRYALEDRIPVE